MAEEIPADLPDWVKEHFGHDKVSIYGVGGMPAAPPAPPGSNARRQGETARAEALAVYGTPGPRPGERPAVRPPRPKVNRRMRAGGERALFEDTQRKLVRRYGGTPPVAEAGTLWRSVFVPVYRSLPWAVRRRAALIGSGAKGWKRSGKD